ncbi:MAG: hypothetical protein U0793_03605 [Gemmataceae bacterium]
MKTTSFLLAAFCLATPGPAEESVTGRIEEVRTRAEGIKGATEQTLCSVLVEGIAFHVTKETAIVFEDARRGTVADLKVGRRVSVRLASDIRDSLPPQVDTDVIVIREKAGKPAADKVKNDQGIQAEVRGDLHFESGHGYFISIKPANKDENELRVWLWISEDKALVRTLHGLLGKEVVAKGRIAQLTEGIMASVPPLGLYMTRFEIRGAAGR